MKNHCTRFEKTFHFVEEQLSSPFNAQMLEFCESDLFQETMQNSEVASSSNCCYEEQSSNPPDIINAATTAATTTANFPLMFEEEIMENDISTPIDLANASHFTNHRYPFSNQDQFDLDLLQNQIPTIIDENNEANARIFSYTNTVLNDQVGPTIGQTQSLSTVCEESGLNSVSPLKFMRLNDCLSRNDMPRHELEFHGDNGGIFGCDPPLHAYNSNELQALSNESQHLVKGSVSSTTPLVSDITSLESETFRVATKLTTEERKEKIHRYLKKRKERNFKKKIKYACRKTLADSRPRVRGRFAKNDEFGENNKSNSNDTDENGRSFDQLVVKDEEQSLESSDIFPHLSGLNSFKCNYPIQSWI
ncbi:uncharacterized protein LOC111885975 isoform X3 [Lactuca sativa]|uniref:uncharacterized protein LOC111885975 isoform X3 n=1 Tax=Lactuca sativa TaxID=4236 RepID=UPI000CD8CDB4|nr:uncharacterized protein LOC111885975 isoform X3 [Lactuca sativa]